MDQRRAERLSEALRQELAELIEYELEDPRLAGVTVTEAHLAPDGRHVRVLVAVKGGAEERERAIEALDHARHYLRRTVAGRLRLFRAPELHFEQAAANEGEDRITQLLNRIRKNREKTDKNPGNAP
jgi:ribosome-binding factor A